MADNIAQINLKNDRLTDASGNVAFANGVVNVDYTSGSVTQNLTITSSSPTNSFSQTIVSSSSNSVSLNNGIYTVSGGSNGVTLVYASQQPSTVSLSFTNPAVVVDGVTFSPADTFSGSNQPVSSICFSSGTMIRTVHGDVPVEELSAKVIVVTASGDRRPVIWVGHRTIKHPSFEQCPVNIRAGAFGDGLPERDLRLSPGHPVLVNQDEENTGGVLVPVMCLINGTTIERVSVDEVTYWHVELDQHDILLAEGLPAESYIDLGTKVWFDGIDGPLHDPDLVESGAARCRPVAIDGPIVDAERLRLDAVFAGEQNRLCAWDDYTVGLNA